MGKWLSWFEFCCSAVVVIVSMILGVFTVGTLLSDLTELVGTTIAICLLIYVIALGVMFVFDAYRKWPPHKSKTLYTFQPPKSSSRSNIGIIILIVLIGIIILVLSFSKTYGWEDQVTFTALGAIGAWVTGIALAVFAYLQWQVHQKQHNLLYTPRLKLLSSGTPVTGPGYYDETSYPYRIEWTILLQNSSKLPISVRHLVVENRLLGEENERQGILTPLYCRGVEPENIQLPFQVTSVAPVKIKWIVEGPNAGDPFAYVSNDKDKRGFQLICKIKYTTPLDERTLTEEIVSDEVYVPLDAKWGMSEFYPRIV